MAIKVLVFESDPAFAAELRSELGKLGCSITVVEDGNVGLQQATTDKPDLILLSIELQRMNGFSVCNKLKKDPALKDVPLIIMSSESSDETFEQHKKLRTRAEDYVHKPIAFGELLQHIQAFVTLEAPPAPDSESAIVIDDEIEIGSTDYLAEDGAAEVNLESSPDDIPMVASSARRVETVDADVDAFAESAFGRLTGSEPPGSPAPAPASEARLARNGAASAESVAAAQLAMAAAGPASVVRGASLPPPVAPMAAASLGGIDPAEHERLREELERVTARLQELGHALDEHQGELEMVREQLAEAERKGREVDELRAKLAASPKGGSVSSREFLDLREALNKKDKELLGLKELVSKKDKQIVEAQDRALATERAQSDVDDRLLALERELDELKEKNESLAADRDLAKKASEDFRGRLEKSRADGEAKERLIGELRARHVEELTAAEDRFAAMRAELDQILANERAEHARALDLSEERRKGELEESRRDYVGRLSSARSEWEQESARARAEAERHEEAALAEQRAELEAAAAREIGQEADRAARLDAALAAAREEATALQRAKVELERNLATSEGHAASLEEELGATRQAKAALEQRLSSETTRADRSHAKWQADRQSLERAKDALALALAQIEEAEERPS